jgi:drug/metabolite transporter (DMT)-like permease
VSTLSFAVVLGLGSSLFWAIANVYIQRAARELGDLRAMAWAQLLAACGFVPAALLFGDAPRWPHPALLVASGVGSALGYYGMLRAFRQGPLSIITPIVASWPLPCAVIGVYVFGERPAPIQLLGGALIVLGAAGNGALARGGAWMGPKVDAIGWAVGGSLGFGAMAAGVARLTPDVGPYAVTPLVWGMQWVVLAPLVLRAPAAFAPPRRWGSVAGMAVCEALGFLCLSLATLLAPVAVVSPPASLSSPLTVLYARVVAGERIGVARGACLVLALVGTVLIAQ